MTERSETNQMWRDIKAEIREERALAHTAARVRLERLRDLRIVELRWFTPHHVRITRAGRRGIQVDFWPSTGRWKAMGGTGGHSWDELMKWLDVPERYGNG